MAGALSDQAWAGICTAAERTPDAGARARLSTILFEEYPAFAYDPERVAAALRRSERMLKHLGALAADYRVQFSDDDDVRTERDLWCLEMLRQRAEAVWLVARAIRRAHRGHRNVQREWLCSQLCTIWLYDFHAPLTYSVPSWGGPPYGPLIAFMQAAIREVVSEDEELPSPAAIRDAILRERDERENARQLGLLLAKPMPA
jgi:hypothetical protein